MSVMDDVDPSRVARWPRTLPPDKPDAHLSRGSPSSAGVIPEAAHMYQATLFSASKGGHSGNDFLRV